MTWAAGHQTHAALTRPVARIDQLSYYPALAGRIKALAGEGLQNAEIAGRLAAEGFRTPHLHERFNTGEIQHLIRRLGLRPGLDHDHRTGHGSLKPGQWWLATLARKIGMPTPTLFGWLKRGWITGRQDTRPPYRWIITAAPADVERLRALHQLPAGYHNRRRWTDTDTLSEAPRTRSLIIMREKPYRTRTEANPSRRDSARARRPAAGRSAASRCSRWRTRPVPARGGC